MFLVDRVRLMIDKVELRGLKVTSIVVGQKEDAEFAREASQLFGAPVLTVIGVTYQDKLIIRHDSDSFLGVVVQEPE